MHSMRWQLLVFLTACGLCSEWQTAAAQQVEEHGQVVVLTASVTVKAGATTVGTVGQGERYPYSLRNGDWYWIEIRQGGLTKKAWIHRNDVRVEAPPAAPAAASLDGSWICVATFKDGKAVTTYVGVRVDLQGDQLTWHYPQPDGSYKTEACRFRSDPTQRPAHFDWWREEKPESIEQRIYSLENGVLRMGTNLDYKTRPKSLETARWQFVVRPLNSADGVELATSFHGWGTAIDPQGTCTIRAEQGKLSIRVPRGIYDLWYGEEDPAVRYNAPRVVQAVKGDFVAQVKVTADWSVGTPLDNGRFSHAAGLLVWESDDHYLRHERNQFQSLKRPGVTAYWTPPLYDRAGTRVSTWRGGNADVFGGRSTWLRLERKGPTITASMSRNGRAWEQTDVLQTTFPDQVYVGVLAHQASASEFICEFEDFQLQASANSGP